MDNPVTKKKTPNISKYGAFPESPYLVELYSKYIQANTEHKIVYDAEGNEYGQYEIPKGKTIPMDTANYSKLFRGNTDVLMSMPEPSAKMFYYITEHLKINANQVCVTKEDYLKFAGYKASGALTYYRALEGLLEAKIISRIAGNTTCYWINPNVIFNGDRTKLKNVQIKPPEKPFSFTKNS